MVMKQLNLNQTANQLNDAVEKALHKSPMPYITKNGIVIGTLIVSPYDDGFVIKKKNNIVSTTKSKSAAMIIAALMNKKITKAVIEEIKSISLADSVSFSSKNDLELFKHHYNIAEKNNDDTKKALMECRFTFANDRYQQAKLIMKKSYMNLF